MAIYNGFSHEKWVIFYSYVNVYQRVAFKSNLRGASILRQPRIISSYSIHIY